MTIIGLVKLKPGASITLAEAFLLDAHNAGVMWWRKNYRFFRG